MKYLKGKLPEAQTPELGPNYAINPTPELYLRSNRALLPARVIAALEGKTMNFASVAGMISALLCGPATACHNIYPDLENLEGYSSVYLGNVTAIHLVGYERSLQGTPDFEFAGEGVTITDGSSEVVLTSVPTLILSGAASGPVTVRLVGCTNRLPDLKERGFFFVGAGGKSAITVWESSAEEFGKVMEILKITEEIQYSEEK